MTDLRAVRTGNGYGVFEFISDCAQHLGFIWNGQMGNGWPINAIVHKRMESKCRPLARRGHHRLVYEINKLHFL